MGSKEREGSKKGLRNVCERCVIMKIQKKNFVAGDVLKIVSTNLEIARKSHIR